MNHSRRLANQSEINIAQAGVECIAASLALVECERNIGLQADAVFDGPAAGEIDRLKNIRVPNVSLFAKNGRQIESASGSHVAYP